jgi:pimeloyl-ACP methyl ester carboxylesterase
LGIDLRAITGACAVAFSVAFSVASAGSAGATAGGATAGGATAAAQRGRLDGMTLVATLPRAQLDAIAATYVATPPASPAPCDVEVRSISYWTIAPHGTSAAASGVLLVPGGEHCRGPFPLVAYAKGTDVDRNRRLADPRDGETRFLASLLAAHGYLVVASDYLGFGRSELPYHPYLHARSQADSIIDAVRAARAGIRALGVDSSAQLFITGYSQGGHAALATQRALEADSSYGLEPTAVAPMAGPYDLSGTFVAGAARLPAGSPGSTLFLPYLVTAYQRIYRNLYASPHEYFRQPFASGIEDLLPGDLSIRQLIDSNRLPDQLADLVTPTLVKDLLDPLSPLRRALDENTLLDWTPRAPVLLCGGSRDPVVSFSNTVKAAAAFSRRGADVTVVDVEQVPAYRLAMPPADAPPAALRSYHGAIVPPLCLKAVRDTFFRPLGRRGTHRP